MKRPKDLEAQIAQQTFPVGVVPRKSRKGRKIYFLRWFVDGEPKEKSTGLTRRPEAEKLADELSIKLSSGMLDKEISFTAFCDRYERERLVDNREGTKEKWYTVLRHMEKHRKPKFLHEFNTSRIANFTSYLREAVGSVETVKSYLRHLRAALSYAVEIQLLDTMPKVVMPRGEKKAKRMKGRAPTGEEFERMRGHIPDGWLFLLDGLWLSGLRLGRSCKADMV